MKKIVKHFHYQFLGLAAFFLVFSASAQATTEPIAAPANAKPTLSAELTQMQVVLENGKEVLKPVKVVKPGDVIEYKVVYTNRTQQPVSQVMAELPLPEGLEYQARSARPMQTAEAAAKDGVFGHEPLLRNVTGNEKDLVPYGEYRRLRWTLGRIAAGAKAEVSARAKVSAGESARSSGVR